MSTESHDEIHDQIQFLASLPTSAGAIKIDGGDGEGGDLRLTIPGTELASLLRLTMFRGRVLLVTIAPQQAVLPLAAPEDEPPVFPQNPLFQDPLADQAARIVGPDGNGSATGANSPPISTASQGVVHVGDVSYHKPAPSARRVRRGLVARGTRRKKAKT